MIIKDIIKDISNRRKHFIGGLVTGLLLTILFTLGIATGMEFKDAYKGGKWDWYDWIATVLGGVVGNTLSALIIWVPILC